MKKLLSAFLLLFTLLLGAHSALAALNVIDDFSQNHLATDYNPYIIIGSLNNTETVTSGKLYINPGPSSAIALIWNGPEKLDNVGDGVSVQFTQEVLPLATAPTADPSAGLALLSTPTTGFLGEFRLEMNETTGAPIEFVSGNGVRQSVSGTPAGNMELLLYVSAISGSTMDISYLFTGNGISSVSGTDTVSATEAYFGPMAYNQSGNVLSHDNLSFGTNVVPEPSTYAAFVGALMLGFALWRRRKV